MEFVKSAKIWNSWYYVRIKDFKHVVYYIKRFPGASKYYIPTELISNSYMELARNQAGLSEIFCFKIKSTQPH